MWEKLTQADIDEAKAELGRRRKEILVRQAAEAGSLEADAAAIEDLDRLASDFAEKFKKMAAPSPEPVAIEKQQPADAPAAKHKSDDKPSGKRGSSQSNFDTFLRALSKSI